MTTQNKISEEYFKIKLLAFLHDPPEKALNIQRHEERARAYLNNLVDGYDEAWTENKGRIKNADIWASIADRMQLPSGREKDFHVGNNLCFIHPLSGESKPLNIKAENGKLIHSINQDTIRDILTTEFKRLEKKFGRNHKRLYFRTWYALKNKLASSYPELTLLPADTRNPNHTIFNHMDLTAAYAGATINPYDPKTGDNPYLFTFWTQGIQDFIAGARASRDLWAGSYMLSWLIAHVIAMFVRDLGPDCIIVPELRHQQMISWLVFQNDSIDESESQNYFEDLGFEPDKIEEVLDFEKFFIPNLPNNFTALIPESYLKNIESKISATLDKLYTEIGNNTQAGFQKDFGSVLARFDVELTQADFVRDLKNAFSWNFAALRIPDESSPYCEFYRDAVGSKYRIENKEHDLVDLVLQRADLIDPEKRYGKGKKEFLSQLWPLYMQHLAHLRKQKKGWRKFRPHQGAPKDKCTLTGFSEVIGPVGHKDCRKFWEECHRRNPIVLHASEKLCPLGVTKRFFFKYYLKNQVSKTKQYDKDIRYLESYPSLEEISLSRFKEDVRRYQEKSEHAREILNLATSLVDASDRLLKDDRVREHRAVLEDRLFSKHRWIERDDTEENFQQLKNFWRLSHVFFNRDRFKTSLKLETAENSNLDFWKDTIVVGEDFKKLLKKLNKEVREFQKELSSGKFEESSESLPFHSLGKYYAILFFDGDELSKWLQGHSVKALPHTEAIHPSIREPYRRLMQEHLSDEDFSTMEKFCAVTPAYHKAISEALANFSLNVVKEIVEDHYHGRLIFAGGDDVLAILSPESAFHCAKKIREIFGQDFMEKKLGNKTASTTPLLMGKNASGSAGIIFSPLKYPFGYALEKAREAEQSAKNFTRHCQKTDTEITRNAFCIDLLNMSGESLSFQGDWTSGFEEFVHVFLEAFNTSLSEKFPYLLRQALSGIKRFDDESFLEFLELEVKRILNQQEGSQEIDKETRANLMLRTKELWQSDLLKPAPKEEKTRFDRFLDFFNFVLRLHRMGREE